MWRYRRDKNFPSSGDSDSPRFRCGGLTSGAQRVVGLLVKAENHLRPGDQNRPFDQVRLLAHQFDRFLFGLGQWPFLEHRAASAHEIEEMLRVDVLLEELTRGRLLVDVELVDVDAGRIQKTSGILAGRSRRFRVERRFRHARRIMETADVDD